SHLNHLLLQTRSSPPPPIPHLNLSQVSDDHAHEATGWSFLQDPRNQTLFAGSERWILNHIINEPPLRDQFLKINRGSQQLSWEPKVTRDYLTQIDQFLEQLLIVCHLTAGHPARGTEILSLRHVNTLYGGHRGVFIENGLVGLVTAYHKGYHMAGSTSLIHRYLPERVSKILVYYLWLVDPFQQQLRTLLSQETVPRSPFLWPPGAGGFT
ncbi:hypothetical protein FE257_007679, partial [Aspergillus nanangensis]